MMAILGQVATRSIMTPANLVTMVRIALVPVLAVAIYFWAPAWWVLIFGFFSMMTDRLDGVLARRYGTSDLGAFLDPLADKLMVLSAMAVLVSKGWVWWLPVVIIAAREFAMSWWRSRLAQQGISVPARKSGKYKTWTQSVAVAFALTPGVVDNARWTLTLMMWIAVAFTLVSFAQYIRDGVTGPSSEREEAGSAA